MAENVDLQLCKIENDSNTRSLNLHHHISRSKTNSREENCPLLDSDDTGDILQINSDQVSIDGKQFDDLPSGKLYHLFIAHSAVDGDQALKICQELENRFLLKCMYYDRDFTIAKKIDENIQHEMEKSVKVLLVLSPDFLCSHWCDMEARLAVQMSFDRKFSLRIIPLILHGLDTDNDLPPFLKPYVCIDARKESDVSAKIHEAYYHSGVVDAAHQTELESRFVEDNRNQNGAPLIELEGKLKNSACFNASHFEFPALMEPDYRALNSVQVQKQMEHILDFANAFCLLRNYRILKNGMFQYGVTVLISLSVTFLYISIGLLDTLLNRNVTDMWNVHVTPGIFLGIFTYPLTLFLVRKFRKQLITVLRKNIWDKSIEHFDSTKCLVLLDVTDLGTQKIKAIRYDIKACQEYTSILLSKRHRTNKDCTALFMEEAKNMILKKLHEWNERGRLVNWLSLESEAYNRHNTWLRKACVCQVLERDVILRKNNVIEV
ncbi:uncharacterized protein LOC134255973 [Saccostrea cucullata]|uniref:uncharacterized protein LOC134255973 n=1 Tax=Saccostrea cuccullata TaxID=36930 RepID=UPI002ED2CB64